MSSMAAMPNPNYWEGCRALVTGGASFIGSHLVDRLAEMGARVVVADDLSSGKLANLSGHLQLLDEKVSQVKFLEYDLRDSEQCARVMRDRDIVFHLAAAHGGRGYVDTHQADCINNLLLDAQVFHWAAKNGLPVVYASSGCVYPVHLQQDPSSPLQLEEGMVGPPYDADNAYGYAKLMGELTLRHYTEAEWLPSAVACRYFTVYGPRGVENHAVMAMIARAYLRQNPFTIWGDGTQVRNWTYVDDIVRGTLLAAEYMRSGFRAVNLGTQERITVLQAAQCITREAGYEPEIERYLSRSTGPLNRVASNALAAQLFRWEPVVTFRAGVQATYAWYRENRTPVQAASALLSKEMER